MKKNNTIWATQLLMIGLLLMVNSCKKDKQDEPSNINFNTDKTYGSVTDIEGNVYKTITIGTQTWMAENLRTTKYRNGEAIPNVTGGTNWLNLSTGVYCNYNNTNNSDTILTYGRLYNWYAANDGRNIAPVGWHVPTDEEWTTLTNYLGGENVAGGKLKEMGTTHWITPNSGATNESGFTAIPGGGLGANGEFGGIGSSAGPWWSSTEYNQFNVWVRYINYLFSFVDRTSVMKINGFSVRCIKD